LCVVTGTKIFGRVVPEYHVQDIGESNGIDFRKGQELVFAFAESALNCRLEVLDAIAWKSL
jgi:hypothetical protein